MEKKNFWGKEKKPPGEIFVVRHDRWIAEKKT